MKTDYLKPFVDGAIELMSTMLDLTCRKGEETVQRKDTYISGIIRLSGSAQGQLTLSFPKRTAIRLVAKMLEMPETKIDANILQDGVGEMVNIVAGNAMAKLSDTEYQFSFNLPMIIVGDNHSISLFRGNQIDTCSLQTDLGGFNLVLFLVAGDEE